MQKRSSFFFVPVLLGTIFEYYDVALYAFFVISFSELFFPPQNEAIALLEAYGLLALSSLSKPLGALYFSHRGDKYGRKIALKNNLFGVGIPWCNKRDYVRKMRKDVNFKKYTKETREHDLLIKQIR